MKKLVVNPPKGELRGQMKLISNREVFTTLMLKVYQQESDSNFKPLITKEGHIRRFIANVEPIRVSVQDYAGKEIKTFAEGVAYLEKIGREVYGDSWTYRLIVNEVKYGRESEYFLKASDDELVEKLKKALDGIAVIEYNKRPPKKNNIKPEEVISTDEAQPQALIKEQENTNE
jgi:hypothetical protein